MKARVMQSKELEKKKRPILDLFNDFTSNKMQSQAGLKSLVSVESLNKAVSKSGFGLGVALLTGGVLQKFMREKAEDRQLDFSLNVDTSLFRIADEFWEQSEATVFGRDNALYLKGSKLSKSTKGSMSDRYSAIYKKIHDNKRTIQMEDLKEINGITKGQHLSGVTSMLSLTSFVWMWNSKSMSRSKQMRVFMLGSLGLSAGIIGIGHYSFKFSSFLHHVHEKYFYATTLKDLQDEWIVKTNWPRPTSFQNPTWDLKRKLPNSVQDLLKLN
jgi:hypothetical protein